MTPRFRSANSSVVAAGLALALLASCQVQPQPRDGVVPPERMELTVVNQSSLDVVLVVNGATVQPLGPGTRTTVTASQLPALPWAAEVRLPTGRSLVATTVSAGDIWSRPTTYGGAESHGVGARVDLSCGRIDLYSGPPILGPAPGPGSPGDCDP